MSGRVHVGVPVARHGRSDTAHPPIYGVQPTSAWYADKLNRPRPLWRRVLSRLLTPARHPLS